MPILHGPAHHAYHPHGPDKALVRTAVTGGDDGEHDPVEDADGRPPYRQGHAPAEQPDLEKLAWGARLAERLSVEDGPEKDDGCQADYSEHVVGSAEVCGGW